MSTLSPNPQRAECGLIEASSGGHRLHLNRAQAHEQGAAKKHDLDLRSQTRLRVWPLAASQ